MLKNTVLLYCTNTQPRTLSPFANSTGSIQQYQQPTLIRTSAAGPKILQAEKDTDVTLQRQTGSALELPRFPPTSVVCVRRFPPVCVRASSFGSYASADALDTRPRAAG